MRSRDTVIGFWMVNLCVGTAVVKIGSAGGYGNLNNRSFLCLVPKLSLGTGQREALLHAELPVPPCPLPFGKHLSFNILLNGQLI
ncbi:MAG: hypothetical protein D3911_08755 [Candidatus Electrothrix sp. AW3_4]|nr:hypothetical protein [Candidatus Electrothrix gigas]